MIVEMSWKYSPHVPPSTARPARRISIPTCTMLDLFTLVRSNLHKCVQRTTSPRGCRTHHSPLVDLQWARWRLGGFDSFPAVDSGKNGSIARGVSARVPCHCRHPAWERTWPPHGPQFAIAKQVCSVPQAALLCKSLRPSQMAIRVADVMRISA